MIDRHNVVNIPNLRALGVATEHKGHHDISLFGRPAYDLTNEAITYTGTVASETRGDEYKVVADFHDSYFADLPGSEVEVEEISTTLQGLDWTVEKHYRTTATEANIKALQSPEVLHIATHGFFISSGSAVNPMIKSGLVLAGANNHGTHLDDGILTAYEATNLNLDSTWLVVLSACESGLGDVKNGEGVYGLQRAFSLAGASNLIMSLWKVDDAATKDFMIYFYGQIGQGVPLKEAFTQSQIHIRALYPNPKYWGPFLLIQSGE
jgi:CHAT domain-containing protein